MQIAVGGCLAQKDRGEIVRRAPVGRRRLRHAQRRLAAGAARPRPPQRRGAGRDRRVARGLPLDAAGQAGLGLLRLGVDQRRLQQHLHVLHRPGAARQGEGPPARRDPGRGAGAGRPGRARGDAARPERERLRRGVPRPRRLRRPAARGRRGSRAWSGSASPARTRASSPTTSSRRWPRRRSSATSCTCRCSPGRTTCCAGCAAATGRSATSGSSTGCAPRCPTRRSPPTSSSASPARPRRTSSRPSTSSGRRASPAPSPSSTPSAPGRRPRRWTTRLPKAVVQERYVRLTALQDEISWAENRAQVGRRVELLVAAGEGSKDAATGRLSGRARDGRLVHFTAADGVRPGDVVETVVTDATPHYLVADGVLLSHRRTRAGDARRGRHPPDDAGDPAGHAADRRPRPAPGADQRLLTARISRPSRTAPGRRCRRCRPSGAAGRTRTAP